MRRRANEKKKEELGPVLSILRVIRGFSQLELSQASGLRPQTISTYERGKMVPGLSSMKKLLAAMGYSLADVEKTKRFIEALLMGEGMRFATSTSQAPRLLEGEAALRQEMEETATAAGNVAARMAQLAFVMLARRSEAAPPAAGPAVQVAEEGVP
ncbi:MAG TPA: helix-turn-helix transcriptional regulator [Thermoanaerobaculia bacterium]|nr:helix-turn-helix transcriptional regulator [Thermoanaerobaculia bacterium]